MEGGRYTAEGLGKQQGGDHVVNPRNRFSLRDYPEDCPSLNVRWYYAVDVPKRKPLALGQPPVGVKPTPLPKKFVAFSPRDSRAIESAFQKLADEEDEAVRKESSIADFGGSRAHAISEVGSKNNTSIDDSTGKEQGGSVKVPVNEDFLFDVDVENRELAPTYWLGPIYACTRGSWFYQEGSSLRPCDENLATQLEEGYLKIKPWRYEPPAAQRSVSQARPRPTSLKPDHDLGRLDGSSGSKPHRKLSADDLRGRSAADMPIPSATPTANPGKLQLESHRLFGAYMNSVVTYQDSTVAWLLTDDFLSRMSSTVYQRFAGGGHLGGVKVVRGYLDSNKPKDGKGEAQDSVKKEALERRRSSSADDKQMLGSPNTHDTHTVDKEIEQSPEANSEFRRSALERQMSNFIASPDAEDPAKQEEEVRKRDEKEIQDDYQDVDGQDQGREIEHLILITHGIGQRLGMRMESVNFIHDVNVLRKTLKSVYQSSPDLQALNSEVDRLPKNCRVQVLPVVWRHLLDFPKQSRKQNRKEQDLTDMDLEDDEDYPSLTDITVDGVPAVRNLITDLALDILLYQSAYREHIAGIVQRECNRIYRLFLQRNPYFRGKVSLIGHSLGSAILFDILSRQKDNPTRSLLDIGHPKQNPSDIGRGSVTHANSDLSLDFDVEDFYCLGSPIGLFQMLKGRTIAGRRSPDANPTQSPLDLDSLDDPFLGSSSTATGASAKRDSNLLSISVSSPRCRQLFNIFHPTDPIAYRIEPLITPAMTALKPQALPYTKKGIFGVQGQGITGIGARVGQSVSGFWSNLTSGVASSLLNRSLGLTGEDRPMSVQSTISPQPQPATETLLSVGVGTNTFRGSVLLAEDLADNAKKAQPTDEARGEGHAVEHPPVLIDGEIETLYAGFQKRRRSQQSDEEKHLGSSPEWQDAEDRAKRLRREEAKVRALNSNGRVDYSIQEGVFDISLIASIASHLSYWADEDVSHFMISQLLSRQRVMRR
ncbi:MAG: hypothetical protein FRX48_02808 [Lasallia pustulata]|uniref:DDHD domain-containing protein n=1 Tax=Lasallia pustulata TaxID=136370 RepID=A0A5M8PVL2_9LECA|nr:MAG: hypothetical protein FRX48_02808 [Lasallia pustulata]